ncbi:MAG UNVERIFIED_CONTAM: hypothetical protein LVR29_07425 [Microcystis novacekii LVE1205-3]
MNWKLGIMKVLGFWGFGVLWFWGFGVLVETSLFPHSPIPPIPASPFPKFNRVQ